MAKLSVGIGEIQTSTAPDDVIMALGLGSCVGIVFFDGRTGTVGVAHCMLPACRTEREDDKPGRYVDRAVDELLSRMGVCDIFAGRLVAAVAGGASMFQFTGPSTLDIGRQNIEAAERLLRGRSIPTAARDVGGCSGRSLIVHVTDGRVVVRTEGNERELTVLAEASRRRQTRASLKVA